MGTANTAATLDLVGAMFHVADVEHRRRRRTPGVPDGAATDADHFAVQVRALPDDELRDLRCTLSHSLLGEVDARMGGTSLAPGDEARPRTAPIGPTAHAGDGGPRVALVSMPWMSPAMPSIQLATLGAVLRADGIAHDVHELYLDFAARTGVALYGRLGRLGEFNAEWVFARQYFGPEHGLHLDQFMDERPGFGLPTRALEARVLRALDAVAREWLDDVVAGLDWGSYDLVGFSLTLSQLASSVALARRLKLAHPDLVIVFGGAQCAGPMGRAILRCFPAVDAVVQAEGEPLVAELARRAHAGTLLADLAGLAWRDAAGRVRYQPGEVLDVSAQRRPFLSYDSYFARLEAVGLDDVVDPWIPFESSRGCWYGEKVQCTFCGLHEIMEYRDHTHQRVLDELEHLWASHGVRRFFAVDLIMPRAYLGTLLPALEERARGWTFFYEVKANMRRHEVEQLARAGVTWIQPGIESLDREQLDLMRKGVRPLQNVQLMKWCTERGVKALWNVIRRMPGERPGSYDRMTRMIPRLVHLPPPTLVVDFELHRFSPFFEDPEAFGIRRTGAHPYYTHIFPVEPEDRDDLVYLHDFEDTHDRVPDEVVRRFERAVDTWRAAHEAGARLLLRRLDDGTGIVIDGRAPDAAPRRHRLSAAELELYDHLDSARPEASLHGQWPAAERVDDWDRDGLVLRLDDRVLALAVREAPFLAGRDLDGGAIPVAYLDGDLASSG